jgi:hypothetical protein
VTPGQFADAALPTRQQRLVRHPHRMPALASLRGRRRVASRPTLSPGRTLPVVQRGRRVTDWSEAAACRGLLPLFYSDDPFSRGVALAICRECRVRGDCELETRRVERGAWTRFGVRAGFTPEERRGWERG